MAVGIEHNIDRIVTRFVGGTLFAETELQLAIENTLKKGEEIAIENITHYVYLQFPEGRYQRTYTLLDSVRASKFFNTGGQVYLSRQAFKKRYYPRYVDEGTSVMEARNFWAPTVEALKAVLEANMLIAANETARLMSEE